MATPSKRRQKILAAITPGKIYDFKEAVNLLKDCATAKFKESLDVSIRLGVDPRKSDQVVRGATLLPSGSGKTVKVAVFAEGDAANFAKKAGADKVGFDDLAEEIKSGQLNYDVIIATTAAMRVVGKLGQILGPRGLMPNPKVGTVVAEADIEKAISNAKAGQVRYRTDKAGIIHCSIGKVDFEPKALADNLQALIADLQKLKPASAKGQYLGKVALSTTMGPGLAIDPTSIKEHSA